MCVCYCGACVRLFLPSLVRFLPICDDIIAPSFPPKNPNILYKLPTAYPEDRRDQILLNERCLLKGWTPLHYAAAEGSPMCVSTLLAAGANVTVHGPVLDGMGISINGGGTVAGSTGVEAGTALQLARALISKEANGPRKKGLQEVARQLSLAIQAVERAKEQRERKEREAKVMKMIRLW